MAKKKQFAGKKTKLARLPLTQALTSQSEAEATSSPPLRPLVSLSTPDPLTWEEVNAGRGGPLAAAFLFLVRELTDLKSSLQSPPAPAAPHVRVYLPDRVPQSAGINKALHQARQSLRDLQSLLASL